MPSSMLKAPLLLLTLSPTRPHVCWQGCLSGAGVVRAFLLPWYHFIFCLLVFSESAFMRLTDNWETLRGANLTPSLSCIITDALPNEKGGKALMRPPGWNNKASRSVERRGEERREAEGRGGERVGKWWEEGGVAAPLVPLSCWKVHFLFSSLYALTAMHSPLLSLLWFGLFASALSMLCFVSGPFKVGFISVCFHWVTADSESEMTCLNWAWISSTEY